MSIEHMAMVFAAEGISYHQKTLLLALCNYTDAHGFCYPGEERLTDDTGMPLRTLQRAKASLVKLRLIRSIRRKDRQTGEPISNLTEVNLSLLAKMRRPKRSYDDNEMRRSLFTEEEKASDLLIRHTGGSLPAENLEEIPKGDEADNRCRPTGGTYPPDRRVAPAPQAGNPSVIPKGFLPPPLSSSEQPVEAFGEEAEETDTPSGGKAAQAQQSPPELVVTPADQKTARSLLGSIPWPPRATLGNKARKLLTERLAVLAAGGWTEADVRSYVQSQIPDWSVARRPDNLVVHVLTDAPDQIREAFTPEPEAAAEPAALTEARKLFEDLERQVAAMQGEIADCSVCDGNGMTWTGGEPWQGKPEWHGHGKMSLRNECRKAGYAMARLRESLEQPDTSWEFAPTSQGKGPRRQQA